MAATSMATKLVDELGRETLLGVGEHTLGRGPLLKVGHAICSIDVTESGVTWWAICSFSDGYAFYG